MCACATRSGSQEIPSVLNSKGEVKPEPAIAELARLYQAAQTEQERRAVCLRAIDAGTIYAGSAVLTLDQIFGSQFASKLPNEGTVAKDLILFATQPKPPSQPETRIEGRSYIGSYFAFDYDYQGKVQYYYFSNLHKGMSSRITGPETVSIAELKRVYDLAQSEAQRRDVALRAIDEGVIQTFPHVPVSTLDAIFGTHLDSTKKPGTGVINFTPAAGSGWFMSVDYDRDGAITNYYLTNLHN